MDIATLLFQLIGGAAGGNLAGGMLKNLNLGTLGNSMAGLIGGGLGSQIVNSALGVTAASASAASGDLDLGHFVTQLLGGGVGGGAMMMIVGVLKQMFHR
jgi:hypothetical protein